MLSARKAAGLPAGARHAERFADAKGALPESISGARITRFSALLSGVAGRKRRSLRVGSWLLAALLMLCSRALAQTTATVTGNLTDPSGAAVPNATLTLTNQDTQVLVGTQISDVSGNFAFQAVPAPGAYTLAAQASGFARLDHKDIVLTTNETRALGNLALRVGATNESVTVTAAVTPVQTGSSERAATLDSHEIGALLVRGLNVNGLLRSIPGVAGASDPSSPTAAFYVTYAAINGTRSSASLPTTDGIMATDTSSQGVLVGAPATDALAEVHVETSNYRAEYGQSGGAIINLTTKSGTTQYHGDVYTYLRNERLNANDFFNNRGNVKRPRYRYVIGGGSIGGPLPVPIQSLKKKVFFFFNDEYSYQGIPYGLVQATVPTDLERKGDFSQTVTVGGALIPVRVPGTTTAYPGNVVPSNAISAYGKALLSVFPKPNFLNRAVSGGNYNYQFQETPIYHRNSYTYRLDFNLTEKLRMYGRMNQINLQEEGYYIDGFSGPNWGLDRAFYKNRIETPAINLVYTISPTMINEFNFGVNHWDEPGGPLNQTEWAKIQRATYGLQGLGQWYPAANPSGVLPFMSFSDVPSAAGFSTDPRFPISGASTNFTIADNFTKVAGAHTFKFGFNFGINRMFKGNQGSAYAGNFAFGRDVNNPLDTNYGYANAIQGVFGTYTESQKRNGADWREKAFEEYVQDTWKVNRRLTLDIGLRFTTRFPWTHRLGLMAGFSPSAWNPAQASVLYAPGRNSPGTRVAVNPLTGAQLPAVYIGGIVPGVGDPANGMIVAGQNGVPDGLSSYQKLTVAPRVGFAWDVFGTGKTAVRGGFGISYLTTSAFATCCGGSYQAMPPISYTPTAYYGTLETLTSSAGTIFPSGVLGLNDSKMASTYSFSTGVQQDIGFSTVLDVAFVGSLGRNLMMSRNLNALPYGVRFLTSSQDPTVAGRPLADNFIRPYKGLGNITYREPSGSSHYYGLQVQVNRRFSRGLEFKSNWTWSKAMDYGSGDGAGLPIYASRNLLSYGLSSFDRTHIVNLTWLYDIPGPGAGTNPVLRYVLSHWNISGTTTFSSGGPVGASFSTVSGVDLIGGGDGQRINVNGNPSLGYGNHSVSRWFDTSVFSQPALGYIGSAGRYVFRGPGQNQWDLALVRKIPVREKAEVQLRSEFYNAFNHPQWSSVNTAAKFDNSLKQINSLFGQVTSSRGARVIQFALRVAF